MPTVGETMGIAAKPLQLYWRMPMRWLVTICSFIHTDTHNLIFPIDFALCAFVCRSVRFALMRDLFTIACPYTAIQPLIHSLPSRYANLCVDPPSTGNLCKRFRAALGTFVLYRNPRPVGFAWYWLRVNFHKCLLKPIRACDVHLRNFLFSIVLSLLHFPSKRLKTSLPRWWYNLWCIGIQPVPMKIEIRMILTWNNSSYRRWTMVWVISDTYARVSFLFGNWRLEELTIGSPCKDNRKSIGKYLYTHIGVSTFSF